MRSHRFCEEAQVELVVVEVGLVRARAARVQRPGAGVGRGQLDARRALALGEQLLRLGVVGVGAEVAEADERLREAVEDEQVAERRSTAGSGCRRRRCTRMPSGGAVRKIPRPCWAIGEDLVLAARAWMPARASDCSAVPCARPLTHGGAAAAEGEVVLPGEAAGALRRAGPAARRAAARGARRRASARHSALSLPKLPSGWICRPWPGTYCQTSSEPSKLTRWPEPSSGPSLHHSRLRCSVSHSASRRETVSALRAAMRRPRSRSRPPCRARRRPLTALGEAPSRRRRPRGGRRRSRASIAPGVAQALELGDHGLRFAAAPRTHPRVRAPEAARGAPGRARRRPGHARRSTRRRAGGPAPGPRSPVRQGQHGRRCHSLKPTEIRTEAHRTPMVGSRIGPDPGELPCNASCAHCSLLTALLGDARPRRLWRRRQRRRPSARHRRQHACSRRRSPAARTSTRARSTSSSRWTSPRAANARSPGPIDVTLSGPFQSEGAAKLPKFDMTAKVDGGGPEHQGRRDRHRRQGLRELQRAGLRAVRPGLQAVQGRLRAGRRRRATSRTAAVARRLGIDPRKWLTDPKNAGEAKVGDTDVIKITGGVDVSKFLDDINTALAKAASLGVQGAGQLPTKLTDEQKAQVEKAIKDVTVEIYTGKDDSILRRMVRRRSTPTTRRRRPTSTSTSRCSTSTRTRSSSAPERREAVRRAARAARRARARPRRRSGGAGSAAPARRARAPAAAGASRRSSRSTRSASRTPDRTSRRHRSAPSC